MSSAPHRQLWWLGTLTLVPVVMVAAFALRSLRTDQAMIESGARREMGSLSARLVNGLETRLIGSSLSPTETLAVDFVNRAANPDAATTSWRLDAQGEPVDAYFASEIPTPPSWWLQLTEAQRAAYRESVEHADRGTNSAVGSEMLPLIARQALAFEHQRPSGLARLDAAGRQAGDAVLLPSGLSLGEVALWHRLNSGLTESTPPTWVPDVRHFLLTEYPSSWPEVRARLDRLKSEVRFSKTVLEQLVRLGEFRRREGEKLAVWRGQWPASEWRPGGRWITAGTNGFFAVLDSVSMALTNEPSAVRPPRWVVSFVHGSVLSGTVWGLAEQLASDTPPYARLQVWLADRALTSHPYRDWHSAPNPGAGAGRSFRWPLPSGEAITGWAGYELADPALLFADYRRRRWTLGGLIVGTALISVFGFWQTQRAFRRQRELAEHQANFVSSVSHELRAPMASLGLMVERLRGDSGLDAARRGEYLRLIARECRRLGQLVQNVLATRRLDQAGPDLVAEPLDLGRLVAETVAAFVPLASEQNVRVDFSVQSELSQSAGDSAETLFEMLGDSLALQQALTNLLENALKHSAAGAIIRVELRRIDSGRRGQLVVTDQGPGVPPAERERIFQRFYRRGSELRRETEGIGLGLALVRHTIEAHQGRVWCEASQPGPGARFLIELPLSRPVAH